ncbi:internal virion protein [Aeromonas phage phiA014S]|uniref:Internal virion protein n=1 Tax=Aeromonas phage phiA014S TaxID=3119845 RepID=A0ABZ2CLV6_9CAUD
MGMMAMAAMAAVSMVSKGIDQKNQGKAMAAQEEARRKNLIQAVKQSNIADAGLKLQAVESYKQARAELEKTSMDAIKAQGAVRTAMNESNLEGRSMERVMRDTENVTLRTKGQITENYERDYHNIWIQRVNNRDSLAATIEGSQAVQMPDATGNLLGMAQAGAQGAMVGQSLWGTFSGSPAGGTSKTKKETK